MKTFLAAAFAALSLTAAIVPAASAAVASAANSNVPGSTGRAVVRGDHSTVAGDTKATRMQQTGSYGR